MYLDVHADAREHAGYRLTDCLIIDVTILGAVHPELESIWITGVRHQLPCAAQIEVPTAELRGRLGQGGRNNGCGSGRQVAHYPRLQRLNINSLIERLPYPWV